jgi:exodeoxyribonuclease VII small subunit
MSRRRATDSVPRHSKTPPPEEPLDFEAALQRLETIVAEMEAGRLPLSELLGRYEEGLRLVRLCGNQLDEARRRIETIPLENERDPGTDNASEGTETPPLERDNEEPSLF